MSSRKESVQLTVEDQAAWLKALGKTAMPSFVWHWYESADRRDAELMFEGQRIRSYTFPVDMPPIAWMLPGGPVVDLGGALQEWRTLNISYFA